jgi:hypothetical protein
VPPPVIPVSVHASLIASTNARSDFVAQRTSHATRIPLSAGTARGHQLLTNRYVHLRIQQPTTTPLTPTPRHPQHDLHRPTQSNTYPTTRQPPPSPHRHHRRSRQSHPQTPTTPHNPHLPTHRQTKRRTTRPKKKMNPQTGVHKFPMSRDITKFREKDSNPHSLDQNQMSCPWTIPESTSTLPVASSSTGEIDPPVACQPVKRYVAYLGTLVVVNGSGTPSVIVG